MRGAGEWEHQSASESLLDWLLFVLILIIMPYDLNSFLAKG